ncbi:hypothetical protein DXG01_008030 [Tephrocybe rancida]|nr:hypothetical protein DXG01_008030 [Tephrocybe rancida]
MLDLQQESYSLQIVTLHRIQSFEFVSPILDKRSLKSPFTGRVIANFERCNAGHPKAKFVLRVSKITEPLNTMDPNHDRLQPLPDPEG